MKDKIETTWLLQIYAGKKTSTEAAIHSIDWMHEEENTNAVLLVGAGNTFI